MANLESSQRRRFGPFELQADTRRLLKDGATVSLRPRAFDLLVALVERTGQLVTKDELLRLVWPRLVVEEAALHVQVSALRKVLGADAITTVSGRGYQFTLPVTRHDPEPRRASKPAHNLPYQLSSFVGREHEIAQLVELLQTNRLITLTGAGGAGKTRLAIEVARRVLDAFSDGVWLVELAALPDPVLVLPMVAQALGLKEQPTRSMIETLNAHVASKKLLLVLDNAEHLLEGCAELADLVLRRSPNVAMLVTSRERLGMEGELTYRVPSLTVPGPGDNVAPKGLRAYEGVRLFVERARLARPDFDLTADNGPSVASICARLDGIPLALELAASRVHTMSIEELSRGLDQRFAVLTDGSRTALPRQRTLRSMVDWSYDLLSEVEQAMFRRLCVFAGGWRADAAEHVCAGHGIDAFATLDLLTSLADKNLIIADQHAGATRYRMLETIRQYAVDRLREAGEEARWRNRHLAWVLALAEASYEPLIGPQQGLWFDRMAAELDNFRLALQWGTDQKLSDAFRLVPRLSLWWVRRAPLSEARQRFRHLLDAIPGDVTRDRARVLAAIGNIALDQGDLEEAERLFRDCDTMFQAMGEPMGALSMQTNVGVTLLERRLYAAAEQALIKTVEIARGLGSDYPLAVNLSNLAMSIHEQGRAEEAVTLFEESLTLFRRLGDSLLTSQALNYIGRAELHQGHVQSAEKRFQESLAMARELKDPLLTILGLERFAELAIATRTPIGAPIMWGAAARLREEIGALLPFNEADQFKGVVAAARATLGDEAFNSAWHEGHSMKLEEVIRYAVERCGVRRPVVSKDSEAIRKV